MKRGSTNSHQNRNNNQWSGGIHFPLHPQRKFKVTQSVRKIMETVLWDRKLAHLIEFLLTGTTINSASYFETPIKLRQTIKNQ